MACNLMEEFSMQIEMVINELKAQANPANVVGMARFGINPSGTLGVPMPALRQLARRYKKQHELALELWRSGIHEARILAGLIDDPAQVTPEQMENWVAEFDSWDVCDQVCGALFDRTAYAHDKVVAWSGREEEFVKRASFAMMAWIAVHDKKAPDALFISWLALIEDAASDERNFVKKAVNWALRQIGKRNQNLRSHAIRTAQKLLLIPHKSAHWIARDAIKELESPAVEKILARRENRK